MFCFAVEWWRSKRYLMLLMMSLACFFNNMLRVNFVIAIVCMVKRPEGDVTPFIFANSSNSTGPQPIGERLSTPYQQTTSLLNESLVRNYGYISSDVSGEENSNEVSCVCVCARVCVYVCKI